MSAAAVLLGGGRDYVRRTGVRRPNVVPSSVYDVGPDSLSVVVASALTRAARTNGDVLRDRNDVGLRIAVRAHMAINYFQEQQLIRSAVRPVARPVDGR